MKELTKEEVKEALNKAYKEAGHNAYFGNGFNSGVEFAKKLAEEDSREIREVLDEIVQYFACNLVYFDTRGHELLKKASELLNVNKQKNG